jgi:hypothetical protein
VRTPKAARLTSIPELAVMLERPYRTVFRWIERAAKEEGTDWLHEVGPRKFMVNLARLAPRYPQWFEPRFASREELHELTRRLSLVEKKQGAEKAARVRVIGRVARLEDACRKGHRLPSSASDDAPLRGTGT